MSLGRKLWWLGTLTLLSLSACQQNLGTTDLAPFFGDREMNVSWTANREEDVNSTGGGYKVYYWNQPNFSLTTASVIDVPFVGGSQSPTSAQIKNIAAGTYYVKVVAYSGFNPQAVPGGNQSAASSEVTVTIP